MSLSFSATFSSNAAVHFADDTAIVSQVFHNDETACEKEVDNLARWSQVAKKYVLLNIIKTMRKQTGNRKTLRLALKILAAFCTIMSILTGSNISWFGSCIKQNSTALQSLEHSAAV